MQSLHKRVAARARRGLEPGATLVDLLQGAPNLRLLLVAAHPDDDIIGAGGLLAQLRGSVRIIYVTDGCPRDPHHAYAAGCRDRAQYREQRLSEAEHAAALANIPAKRLRFLGYTDQEAYLFLPRIARELALRFRRYRADAVITHPYEAAHPDHDATAYAVHAARRLLLAQGLPAPEIVEFTSYHGSEGRLETGEFLPSLRAAELTIALKEHEQVLKRRMLECHRSQQATLGGLGFRTDAEKFRLAPEYDFTRLPTSAVLYERFAPAVTVEAWLDRVRSANTELGFA
ncbi:MAG TPA: PIG-L family deacetylase [Polyangiaceae bacterium]|nr:PIG-L family deacetylase [Polyangiaceae bacterium]